MIYLLLLLLWASPVGAMTVEEAYRAIPHGRTVFDNASAQMSRQEVEYLQRLFEWIDQAIVAKETVMQNTPADEAYAPVWSLEKTLQPPSNLKPLQAQVEKSIKSEYRYLKDRQTAGIHTFNAGDPNVQTASQYAHQAYSELMALYPKENPHNKQAFYDYLCALDFL